MARTYPVIQDLLDVFPDAELTVINGASPPEADASYDREVHTVTPRSAAPPTAWQPGPTHEGTAVPDRSPHLFQEGWGERQR